MSLDNDMNNDIIEEEKTDTEEKQEISARELNAMTDIEKACLFADQMSPEKYKEELERLRKREAKHTSFLALGILLTITMCIVMCVLVFARISYIKKLQEQVKLFNNISTETPDSFDKVLKKLDNLNNYLEAYYLFDKSDYDKIGEELYKSLLTALDDPYTVYYSPEEYKAVSNTTSASFGGVGVQVSKDKESGYVEIVNILDGSDALKKDVMVGDYIIAVDGVPVDSKELSDVTLLMKGEIGTEVQLTLLRPSTNATIEVSIVRTKVNMNTVAHMMLDNGVGYIHISQFGEATATQFESSLDDLLTEGMKALVVDIRENPGGMVTSVNAILDRLLPEGLLVYTEDKNGNRSEYKSDATCLKMPMAVLVNGKSASASEIFAGAMKDYKWATLIGTTTFGKGIVQTIHQLGDGSAVKVTVSRYFTPSGVCIHGTGIEPDIELEYDAEKAVSGEWKDDNQVYKAYELLLEELK